MTSQIWIKPVTLEQLNQRSVGTLLQHMGIVFTNVGHNFLEATMPVTKWHLQPQGRLHGGASVVLAESLGSIGSILCVDPSKTCVGIEINANHLRGVFENDTIRGTATAVHIGRTLHVWDIRIYDNANRPSCISRLTTAVIAAESPT